MSPSPETSRHVNQKRQRHGDEGGRLEQRRYHSRSRSGSRSRSRSEENGKRRRQLRGDERHEDLTSRRTVKSRTRSLSPISTPRRTRWGSEKHAFGSREANDTGRSQRQYQVVGLEGEEKENIDESVEEAEPLPVAMFQDELMKAVRSSQVLVCTGETGSGKTTQIPQYLLELVRERDPDTTTELSDSGSERDADSNSKILRGKLMVAVTQPRRVAATSVARRVADERGCRVGDEVGYSIRFDDRTGPRTRIKYMTDGVLVRECLEDPQLTRYAVVMLDEAHERSIDTDILFGLLKRALARRPDLHALITSATLDVGRFTAFFNGCPSISIPGRTHAVDVYHSKTRQVMTASGPASPHYVEDAVDIILKIHRTRGPGHVLAFFTGQDEIERACRLLSEAVAQDKAEKPHAVRDMDPDNDVSDLLVVPLYGALSAEAQGEAFRTVKERVRKVVMATNIAETSVTVPGVRYVVDPGYVKQKTYDPARRMESLVVVPISQVAAQQRAGRAGRTAHGLCYRLYSKDCYKAMLGETIPEILRTNLANTLLYLKVLGVDDVLAFDFLDPPAEDQALEALQHLYCLGAIDQDGRATEIGRRMSRFPLDPSLSRTLLAAGDLGCVQEILTIVALLSVESVWFTRSRAGGGVRKASASGGSGGGRERHGERDEEAENSHAVFRHHLGDHFTYLEVYRAWEASGCSDAWAKNHFLRVRALRTARSVRGQLVAEFMKASGRGRPGDRGDAGKGQEMSSCGRDLDRVRKAVCAGFFMNAGQRCSKEWVYRSVGVGALQADGGGAERSNLTLMYLHPTCALLHSPEPPEHVVYTELVLTARPFMRHVMSIKGRWVKSRIESVPDCSADRLCGRALSKKEAEDPRMLEDAIADGSHGKAAGASREVSKVERKVAAIEAARARFLARKQSKQ